MYIYLYLSMIRYSFCTSDENIMIWCVICLLVILAYIFIFTFYCFVFSGKISQWMFIYTWSLLLLLPNIDKIAYYKFIMLCLDAFASLMISIHSWVFAIEDSWNEQDKTKCFARFPISELVCPAHPSSFGRNVSYVSLNYLLIAYIHIIITN